MFDIVTTGTNKLTLAVTLQRTETHDLSSLLLGWFHIHCKLLVVSLLRRVHLQGARSQGKVQCAVARIAYKITVLYTRIYNGMFS